MPQKNSNPKVGPSPGTDIESDFESFINGGAGAPLTKSRVDTLYDQHVQQNKPQDIESDFANFIGGEAKPAPEEGGALGLAKSVGNSLLDVVRHPIDNAPTIGATIGSLFAGSAKNPTTQAGPKMPNLRAAAYAGAGGAAGSLVKDTYNSVANQTEFKPEEVIKNMLLNGAEQGAYEFGGRKLVNAGGALVKGAGRLYESALKPSKTILKNSAAYGRGGYEGALEEMLSTGLNEKIPVGRQGLDKIDDITEALNNRIAQKVQNAPGLIPAHGPVLDPARDVVQEFAKDPTSPEMANRARQVLENFLSANSTATSHPTNFASGQIGTTKTLVPNDLTASAAQEQKQAIYRGLKATAYGERKGGETEAKKAVARGLKNEIERVADVGPENRRESDLLFLRDALDDAMPRIGNRNVLSLYDYLALIAATGHATGAMLPGGATPGAAFAASLGQRPAIASPLAIGMNRVGRALNVNPKTARTLLEAGRNPTAQMIQDFLSEN